MGLAFFGAIRQYNKSVSHSVFIIVKTKCAIISKSNSPLKDACLQVKLNINHQTKKKNTLFREVVIGKLARCWGDQKLLASGRPAAVEERERLLRGLSQAVYSILYTAQARYTFSVIWTKLGCKRYIVPERNLGGCSYSKSAKILDTISQLLSRLVKLPSYTNR